MGLLTQTAEPAKEVLAVERIAVVADRGYFKIEDIEACEMIFTTLMGEDVEARRKFIEENALDVKNLDI